MLRIVNVVGARPNFMKIAPVIDEMRRRADRIEALLVHTIRKSSSAKALADSSFLVALLVEIENLLKLLGSESLSPLVKVTRRGFRGHARPERFGFGKEFGVEAAVLRLMRDSRRERMPVFQPPAISLMSFS